MAGHCPIVQTLQYPMDEMDVYTLQLQNLSSFSLIWFRALSCSIGETHDFCALEREASVHGFS